MTQTDQGKSFLYASRILNDTSRVSLWAARPTATFRCPTRRDCKTIRPILRAGRQHVEYRQHYVAGNF